MKELILLVIIYGTMLYIMARFTRIDWSAGNMPFGYPANLASSDSPLTGLYETTWKLLEEENFTAAIAMADSLLADDELPAWAVARLYQLKSLALMKSGDLEEALEQIKIGKQKAVEAGLIDDYLTLLGTEASIHFNGQDDDRAREVLEEAWMMAEKSSHKADPEFQRLILAPICHNLAWLAANQGELRQAATYAAKAKEIWGNNPDSSELALGSSRLYQTIMFKMHEDE